MKLMAASYELFVWNRAVASRMKRNATSAKILLRECQRHFVASNEMLSPLLGESNAMQFFRHYALCFLISPCFHVQLLYVFPKIILRPLFS
jgi:hypothetical protein